MTKVTRAVIVGGGMAVRQLHCHWPAWDQSGAAGKGA